MKPFRVRSVEVGMDARTPRPTDAELEILRVVWDRGPATVKQIQDGLSPGSGVSGTSVLKLLQIMEGKGLVRRDASARFQNSARSWIRSRTSFWLG